MAPRIGPCTKVEQSTKEDYNLPSEPRKVLLRQLKDLVGNVAPHFWAAIQVCSLDSLGKLVQRAQTDADLVFAAGKATHDIVRLWKQASSSSASSSSASSSAASSVMGTPQTSPIAVVSTSPEDTRPNKRRKTTVPSVPSVPRSHSAKMAAQLRDNYRCVLTNNTPIQVAHIFPHCLLQREENGVGKRYELWRLLRLFWPEQTINAWTSEIFPHSLEEGVETTANMITLGPAAHILWNQGKLAIKPVSISDDKKTLLIQFFWQSKITPLPSFISPTTIPLSTEGLNSNDGSQLTFHFDDNNDLFYPLRSGHYIEITTDDSEKRPLPSFQLLQMQWCLQRISGMAGAAEADEEDDDYSSDDDLPGFVLDDYDNIAGTSNEFNEPALPDSHRPDPPISPPLSSQKPDRGVEGDPKANVLDSCYC